MMEVTEEEHLHHARLSLLISNLGMRTLRLLFRDRYKAMTGMDWENGSVKLAGDFIKRVELNLKLTNDRKLALGSADINKWDFILLANVILIMKPRASAVTGDEKIQDKSLVALLSIRRGLEEKLDNGIPNTEFEQIWSYSRAVLLRLGAREKDIDYIRTSSKLLELKTNTATVEKGKERKSKVLRSRAKECIAAGEFQEGVQLYSEALLLTGLSYTEKSCVYSARSQAYIRQLEDHRESLADDVVQKYLDVAMEDASFVTQLEPKLWEGHYLEGKCFQLKKLLKEAVDSFETALTLNPNSEETINARSECRLDLSDGDGPDCDSFRLCGKGRIIIDGVVKDMSELIGVHELLLRSRDPAARARGCLFLGHRYLKGDGVPLNKKKGTEYFLEAAKTGSPDGALNAGLSYLRGIGVKRNIQDAIKYFEKAANHSLKPGGCEHQNDNKAVLKAKESLGTLYQNGVGKARDYVAAKEFYTSAALEGYAPASEHLVSMYLGALGIPQDLKRAVQYQRLAIEQGSGGTAVNTLAWLFAQIGDDPRARYWYNRAIALSYPLDLALSGLERFEPLLQLQEKKFEKLKKMLPQHVRESRVPIYTLYDRYIKKLGSGFSQILKLYRDALRDLSNPALNQSARSERHIDVEEVKKFAADGEVHAGILLGALEQLDSGVKTIQSLLSPRQISPTDAEVLKKLALAQVTSCFTAQVDFDITLPDECHGKLLEIAAEFISNQERSDADLHARICRLSLSMRSLEEAVEFAEACKGLYPEEAHFHYVHANMLGHLEKYEEGLKVVEESLKLFPGHLELLFLRAQLMNLSWQPNLSNGDFKALGDYFSTDEPLPDEDELVLESLMKWVRSNFRHELDSQIQAFQDFIREAPADYRDVPEAYYWIAKIYAFNGKDEIQKFYSLGVEAEKKLLSNFLPYDSICKQLAEQYLKLNTEVSQEDPKYSTRSRDILDQLLEEDAEELEENRKLMLTNPRRIVTVRDFRKRLLRWEGNKSGWENLDRLRHPPSKAMEGKKSSKGIQSLKNIRFDDIDPTLHHEHEGHLINLTIMDEYYLGIGNNIITIAKDDNDDFSLITFYPVFDMSDPSTKKKLGFGSCIQVINPYWRIHQNRQSTLEVHYLENVIFLSNGEETRICRYCWDPNPGLRCSRCKTARYCNKECQRLDWEELGHKDLCKGLCKRGES